MRDPIQSSIRVTSPAIRRIGTLFTVTPSSRSSSVVAAELADTTPDRPSVNAVDVYAFTFSESILRTSIGN